MNLFDFVEIGDGDVVKQAPGDKATLGDFRRVKDKLPPDTFRAIPQCIYDRESGFYDLDAMAVLLWSMMIRKNPVITLSQAEDMIPFTDKSLVIELAWEIMYYWTNITREELDKLRAAPGPEDATENPTPSDSNLTT